SHALQVRRIALAVGPRDRPRLAVSVRWLGREPSALRRRPQHAARLYAALRSRGRCSPRVSSAWARSWVSERNTARHATVRPATMKPVTQTPTAWLRTGTEKPSNSE